MSADEQYIRAIDQQIDVQRNAETETERLVQTIGKLVVAVAANEATYEIEAASDVAEPDSLTNSADTVASTRETLTETIEEAIKIAKYGFHAKHQQNVLRNDLLGDFRADPSG